MDLDDHTLRGCENDDFSLLGLVITRWRTIVWLGGGGGVTLVGGG